MPCRPQKEFPSFSFQQRDWTWLSKDESLGQVEHTVEKRRDFQEGESSQGASWGTRSSHFSHVPHWLYPHEPLFRSSAVPRPFLPLGLCNCCSICLECLPRSSSHSRPLVSSLKRLSLLLFPILPLFPSWHLRQSVAISSIF